MAKRPLEKMFNEIYDSYDRMNRILTFGLDRRWREKAAKLILQHQPKRMLDLCTGTGDLACILADMAEPEVSITALDFASRMLEIASSKAGTRKNLEIVEGDAASLNYDNDTFDAIGISFGFRNLTYRNPIKEAALAEVRRVLRPGGVFVIVESSQPRSAAIRFFRDRYVNVMVAGRAAKLSGNKPAYNYFAESVKRFYTPDEITELLTNSGFEYIRHRRLFFGAVAITEAT